MLTKLTLSLTQKKSERAYQSYLRRLSCMMLVLGLLGILLNFYTKLGSFAAGMLLGMTVALLGMGAYFFWVTYQPKRLHRLYVAAYDERNLMVNSLAAQLTLVSLFVLVFVLLCLSTFAGWKLTYDFLLLTFTYAIVLVFVLLKLSLSKLL